MSGIERKNEEDKDNSRHRSRKAILSAVQESCGQSSDNIEYQETVIDCNNEQVDSESKEIQLKEELVKHLPKTVKAKLSEAESFNNSLQAITTRCEVLIKFTDRAQLIPGIATKTDTPSFQDLLNLLQMYRNGLAQLLKERCYYFLLINANREKASSYAEQLTNLADTLLDKDMKEEAKIIVSSDGLLTTMFLQQKHEQAQTERKEFLERLESESQKRAEYAIFFMLYQNHVDLFNMQETLDLLSECLKIACGLEDKEMMIDVVSRMAHVYQILGKYENSYDILADVLKFQIDNVTMKCRALNNFSVTALLMKKKEDSLDFAKKSLEVAKETGNKSYMACAYGNIGLAKESMGHYYEAFEPYRECLKLGLDCRDDRVINNSYCNLGRAHEGLGEKRKARKYYKKAVDARQPPKSHWCDTVEMRFSGDYLLAKLAVSEKNWQEAKYYLEQVIKRCKTLRKSVQDSSMKITFNDTQRKPYQYLQHVLLEKGEVENALFVAEQGRARDFYDKFAQEEGDRVDCLNTPQALLDFAKSQNVSVLFLSTLEVVDKLCGWFISQDGSIEAFSTPQSEWEEILHELCTVMYLLQGRHVVEFRGVEEREDEDGRDADIQEAFKLLKKVNKGSTEEIPVSADVCEDQQDCQHETNSVRNEGATKMGESCLASETRSGFTNASTSELLNDTQSDRPQASGTEEGIQCHPNNATNQGATRMGESCLASETRSGFTNASTSELSNDSQSDLLHLSGPEEGIQHHPNSARNQGATRMEKSCLASETRSGFTNASTSELLNDSQPDRLQASGTEEGIQCHPNSATNQGATRMEKSCLASETRSGFTNASTSELLNDSQSDRLQASGTEEGIQCHPNSATNQGATRMEKSCLASETRSGFTNASTSKLFSGTEEGIQCHPNSATNQGATRMEKSCLASETRSGFTNASTSELLNDSQSDRPQAPGTEEGIQHHPDPADVCNVQQGCQPQTSNTTNQGATRMEKSCLASENRSGFKKTTTSGVLDGSQSDHLLHPSVSEEGIFTTISTSELYEGDQSDHFQFSGTEERIQDQQDSDNRKELSVLIDKLSDLVLKPIEQQLEKLIGKESVEKPRLLVIPQGKSFNIPYAALRLKNNQPLCSQVTILEAFSFHSFFNSIKQHEKSKDDIQDLQDALIVGNPTNDLPWAESEANQIAELLRVTALIGDSATYKEVLSRLSNHRIIHFACHGELSKNSLQLAPVQNEQGTSSSKREAILTVADIEKVKIRADMVVLSACHTARGEINSEGVLGLARAFLVSGAKSVVTALWAIPDEGTEHFMKQFYLNLSRGQPVADALGKTMCQIREKEDYKDVINWGAFKVYGHNEKVVFNGNLAL